MSEAFAWSGKTVLVTGGTGTFGQAFARYLLESEEISALRVFSRDELKQSELARRITDPRMRYFIGDVRDAERLRRALDGVDVVIHAAALKQVPACEYNPFEAVKTNILGAQNVIEASIDRGVKRVVGLSTDKAASPVNLYGATKLCAEKLFVQGNAYVGSGRTIFGCVRYGNVVGSRGSVIPLFMEQRASGSVTVTDRRMTRFWMTVREAVDLVKRTVEAMHGGEIFIPKLPSVRVMDLVEGIAPGCEVREIGIRAGEKLHETLVTAEESRHSFDVGQNYIITPEHPWWTHEPWPDAVPMMPGAVYSSDQNDRWLSAEDIKQAAPKALREAHNYEAGVLVASPE